MSPRRAAGSWLRLRLWFPHVPLFFAAAVLGLLEISPIAGQLVGMGPEEMLTTLQDLLDAGIRYTPRAISGLLLVIMSFGLLTRSRLAWLTSMLLVLTSLVLFQIGGRQPGYWLYVGGNGLLLAALVLARHHFQRSNLAAATLFAGVSTLAVLIYATLGTYLLGAQFKPPVDSLSTAFYSSIVTISTVGYGEFVPLSTRARMFIASVIVLGITVVATSIGTLIMPLVSRQMAAILHHREGNRMERANHYIIVGRTALAQNCHRELDRRGQKVTFILKEAPTGDRDTVDHVIGDAWEAETLEKAGVRRAVAVLALSDDASDNAFVVISVKDIASGVKTVTVASDAGNLSRMKRIHPDLIIAPQILGGELLAMALTGEKVDSSRVMDQLLHLDG